MPAANVPVQVSFEFFPPADGAMEATLWQSVQRLAPLAPRFVSVTYGADGSTRTRTHNVVTRVQRETHLTGAPHLTCVGASREEILEIARDYWNEGIRHIVALRGDLALPAYLPAATLAALGRNPGTHRPKPNSVRATAGSHPAWAAHGRSSAFPGSR